MTDKLNPPAQSAAPPAPAIASPMRSIAALKAALSPRVKRAWRAIDPAERSSGG